MPLYKMTEKRLAKRAKEDEEGLTDLKAAMGMEGGSGSSSGSGSDSDDSEGSGSSAGSEAEEEGQMDSEDDSSSDEEEEETAAKAGEKRKRPMKDEDGDVKTPPFHITIENAFDSPLYPLPSTPGGYIHHACVLCPGKKMKTETMIPKHLESGSHLRASKRWLARLRVAAKIPLPSDDPREVVKEILTRVEDHKNKVLRVRSKAGKGKRLPETHPGFAPIDEKVLAARTRRREEKFARRAKKKDEKARKKARLAALIPPGQLEAKKAAREEKRRIRKERTAEMRAMGIEREGKGRSPRNVRKDKKALKLLEEAGLGTGANAGELGLNRMAKRMKWGGTRGTGGRNSVVRGGYGVKKEDGAGGSVYRVKKEYDGGKGGDRVKKEH